VSTSLLRGQYLVVGLYVALVALAGLMGVLFSLVVENPDPPALLFLFELPTSPVGFAVYGAVTVGLALGIPLALVVWVSAGIDDGAPD
jgi:hypothetical protein